MAMTADTMKRFGFGEYPDWRWRCAMRNIEHTLDANTAAEYFTGPGEEALLEDEALVDFVFPCLKWSLHPDFDTGMSEAFMTAVRQAISAGNEDIITLNSDSVTLEASVLGGLAPGDLRAVSGLFTPLGQLLYERMFFDVRSFLEDTTAVCHLLFHDKERLRHRGRFDLISKVMAYGLGYDDYSRWRVGTPSDNAKTLHRFVESTLRFSRGLELTENDAPDDMERLFTFLFSTLPDGLHRGESDAGVKRGFHTYTPEEMATISEMLDKLERVAG